MRLRSEEVGGYVYRKRANRQQRGTGRRPDVKRRVGTTAVVVKFDKIVRAIYIYIYMHATVEMDHVFAS